MYFTVKTYFSELLSYKIVVINRRSYIKKKQYHNCPSMSSVCTVYWLQLVGLLVNQNIYSIDVKIYKMGVLVLTSKAADT